MKDYSFTITLKPIMYRAKPSQQYDLTYDELYHRLLTISNYFSLVAELTKNENIHYHGNIRLKNKGLFFDLFRESKIFGFNTCRMIEGFEAMSNCKEYCRKEIAETCEILNRRPIIKDDYDIFTPDEYAQYGTHW